MSGFAVITTIQNPTPAMETLSAALAKSGWPLLVIGDSKGPAEFALPGAELVPLDAQPQLSFTLGGLLPTSHYARKNLGYLEAIGRGAGCIYETDDDNAPLPFWKPRSLEVRARLCTNGTWCNVYGLFGQELIWPRGLPLDEIHTLPPGAGEGALVEVNAPIQQALVNGSPDVDAIWRLLFKREIAFEERPSVMLAPRTWCPFNSQNTWWWPQAYPLMYLPSFCTFRMTDIWRSFVAQRCLWELGHGVVFHAPDNYQVRNPHVLTCDFQDEVPGYLGNKQIAGVLDALELEGGVASVGDNLLRCYESLIEAGVLPSRELPLVKAWLTDLERRAGAR